MTPWYPLSVSTIGDEEIDAATEVLRSKQTTMGEKVEEFEEQFAWYVDMDHAVMVNSGSSADLLMAFASGDPGRVIIPAVTWPTHVWAWHFAGWDIHFVDVDGLNTTHEILAQAVNDPSDMVSLVHLMGIPADVDTTDMPCRLTEDCCEALGADVGHCAEMATWSFFFSHHITTMEGGMVTTDFPGLAKWLRSMRSHGWARGLKTTHDTDPRYTFINPGLNVRPTEVAAAIGLVQLKRIHTFNEHRDQNRKTFADALYGCPGIELPVSPDWTSPSWFGLPFFAADRNGLADWLERNGVETRPILGGNLLRQPAFANFPRQHLPGADRVHDHGLYVGLHPTPDSGVERVAELIWEYAG